MNSIEMTMFQKRNFNKLHQRIQRSYEMHKAKPLPPEFKPRLDGPSTAWNVFRRLQMATAYADSCAKDCMVFSYEERLPDCSGQRMFLVAHPQHMWLNHKCRPCEERCSYEVIREGFPCKLYFDLEYHISYNPSKNGIQMTNIFIRCIIAAMVDIYNLRFQMSDVLWLDGSTEQKFSCHLILQMGDIAFQNNIQTGLFVSSLLSSIEEKIEANAVSGELWPSAEELKTLFINTKNGKQSIFCDDGVYTKNRNFRLYLSTKFGKKNPLVLSKFNLCKPIQGRRHEDADEYTFYSSLITYFGNETKIVQFLCWTDESICRTQPKQVSDTAKTNEESFTGRASSPFPELDNFILGVVRDSFIVGFIRKWMYCQREQIIIYDIGNYRFCQNIGRHHKSNNIRMVVDMKKKMYYQNCHDPECRKLNYRSEESAIPDSVFSLNIPDDFFEDDCFSQLENTNFEVGRSDVDVTEGSEKTIDSAIKFVDHSLENSYFENFNDDFENFNDDCEFSQLPIICSTSNILQGKKLNLAVNEDDCFKELRSINFFKNPSTELACEAQENKYQDEHNDRISFNLPEGFWSEQISDGSTKNLCGSDISGDEERIMAEAAAAVEATNNDTLFSEETIF